MKPFLIAIITVVSFFSFCYICILICADGMKDRRVSHEIVNNNSINSNSEELKV